MLKLVQLQLFMIGDHMPNQYGEIWGEHGCTNVVDICITFNGKYIDIGSEYGGTWVVRYDNKHVGIGHSKSGTGFKSRLDAFKWAKNEFNFPETWKDILLEDKDFCQDRQYFGDEYHKYLDDNLELCE